MYFVFCLFCGTGWKKRFTFYSVNLSSMSQVNPGYVLEVFGNPVEIPDVWFVVT